ncbi:N-6 DNA methylase [Shewanella algae]|uniref:N-6 DNA methylase n=1 Tax=Shewanella algae TaxID=38313 RepID=UPI0006987745|nr:N-6 DNA methylase [Shewanella algae]
MAKLNEKKTEALVKKQLEKLGYFDDDDVIVEEQASDNPVIEKLLKGASKSGYGDGRPEFIIQSKKDREFIIVIECKADIKRHQSKTLDRANDYAVDGVLHYANFLCRAFNVLAIGISGQTRAELKVTNLIIRKGKFNKFDLLEDTNSNPVCSILGYKNYFDLFIYDPQIHAQKERDVLDFSKALHNFIRDYAHLSDAEKPLIVSGILLALKDDVFLGAYASYPDDRLPKYTLDTIHEVVDNQNIPNSKKLGIKQQYGFIQTHTKLIEYDDNIKMSALRKIIIDLEEHVFPFIRIYHDYDIVGEFYNEFLRYSGGDGKMGIVLTPKHITELFTDFANLTPEDTVLDPCCGTGAFLISAMHKMIQEANGDEVQIDRIKKYGLVGIESQPKMFALAASNMILRGDGSCQLFEGSCFNESHAKDIINLKEKNSDGDKVSNRPNVGFINPPYSLKGEGLSELQFVKSMLDYMQKGGIGIAIIPIGCVIESSDLKRQILEKHTLEAVISMPDDLFGKSATVVACILIFTSGKKHPTKKKVWFSRAKDDGFVTLKHIGRVDHFNKWPAIKEELLNSYFNRVEEPGVSVLQEVTHEDEWCAEAYIETDYEDVHELDFEETIKNYLEFKHPEEEPETKKVKTSDWKEFTYDELFEIKRGLRVVNRDLEPGETPLIRCVKDNNGVVDYVNLQPLFEGNKISVNYNGSVGEAFYQPEPFFPTDDVLVLSPREEMFEYFNEKIGLYLCTVIKLERFRFHYSRKWNMERMRKTVMKLPSKNGDLDLQKIEDLMSGFRFGDQLENA